MKNFYEWLAAVGIIALVIIFVGILVLGFCALVNIIAGFEVFPMPG